MDNVLYLIIKSATIIFLFAWGAYERISAIKKGKKHSDARDNDRNSLIIFYVTIFLGYGIGIPVSFTGYGRISILFPYISLLGFFIIALGLFIRLIAIRTLAEQFTYTVKIIDKHELIISGIYKYIRHPSYSGQALIFLGCGLAFSNWLSILLLFVPSFIASLYRMSVEEKVLMDYFSDQYADYMKETKRLIPLVY